MFTQLINQTLDRYRIISLLGEGGMGAVFKAFDLTLQREVALKVMHSHIASQADFQDRFLQEARTAAKMDHPSIVQVYDFGQTQNLLYIVMEFIPGDNLSKMLKDLRAQGKWILLPEAIHLIRQVSIALDYAHDHGITHRDIKPGNIMIEPVSSDGLPYRPVLTDLGLAKLAGGGVQTVDGTSMGTPAYMSPEQALGNPSDRRSDVYSVGVLLFELATGRLPFPAKNLIEAIQYHTKEPPPRPRSINPQLPLSIEQIILKAMEKDPDKRFQSARDLAMSLSDALSSLQTADVERSVLGEQVSLLTQYENSLDQVRGQSIFDDFERIPGISQDRIQVMKDGETIHTLGMKPEGLVVGRGSDCDIVLEGTNISRRHARIELVSNKYRIVDLGSTNGTFLANARLLPGIAEEWTPDRVLRIGNFWLRLVRANEEDRTAVARAVGGTIIETSRLHTSSGKGSIGVFLENEQISVEPGKSVSLKIILLNQGNLVDKFTVNIQGLPARWLDQAMPSINLMPGDQQEVTLSIHPPRLPKSRAGRYPFVIQVAGQQANKEVIQVKTILTVGTFTQFRSELHPQRVKSGVPVRLLVENQGNLPEVFAVSFRDRGDELQFSPPKAQIRIKEGETSAILFEAGPRQFRLVGGSRSISYNVEICPSKGEVQSHSGEIIASALLPGWVIGMLIFVCVGFVGLLALLLGGYVNQVAQVTQTHQAALTSIAQVVQSTNQASTATASALQTQGIAAVQAATATQAWLELDDDRDGLKNQQELELGTRTDVRDTDEDGLSDGEEVSRGTLPLDDDTDNDGLKDGSEIIFGTDPLKKDTDQDGIPDNKDDAPGATSTVPPTATQPSSTPPFTATPSFTPTATVTPPATSTQTPTPTLTLVPTATVPPSSYTYAPPLIDGYVTSGEWNKAFLASNLPNGFAFYQNDSNYLYFLIDLTGDTTNDLPITGPPWGDFFWLVVDVNENQVIDSNTDLLYAQYPGTYSLGLAYQLGGGSTTGINPTLSYLGAGFGKSLKSSTPHRIWEFALSLPEISAAPGQNVALGLRLYSQNPGIDDFIPGNLLSNYTNFITFFLDLP